MASAPFIQGISLEFALQACIWVIWIWLARPAGCEPNHPEMDGNVTRPAQSTFQPLLAYPTLNGTDCNYVPLLILKRLHGSAMDLKYMSADSPYGHTEESAPFNGGIKIRRAAREKPAVFRVQDIHFELLSNEPAWNYEWNAFAAQRRLQCDREPIELKLDLDDPTTSAPVTPRNGFRGRDSTDTAPWRCETRRKWLQLPIEYYPRYLRSVQCSRPSCWYGNYECMARRMTVYVLQRQLEGGCADATKLKKHGFTEDRAEIWRWVKADINFYCECVKSKKLPF